MGGILASLPNWFTSRTRRLGSLETLLRATAAMRKSMRPARAERSATGRAPRRLDTAAGRAGDPNAEKRDPVDQKNAQATKRRPNPGAGDPNTEKCDLVDQKPAARFERVEAHLVAHPALFATQGAVVATWRTCRGRRPGPYSQVSFRERG